MTIHQIKHTRKSIAFVEACDTDDKLHFIHSLEWFAQATAVLWRRKETQLRLPGFTGKPRRAFERYVSQQQDGSGENSQERFIP